MLEQIKAKIESVETQLQTAISSHSYLAGALAALKEILSIAEAVAPANPVVQDLEEVQTIGDAIENAIKPAQESTPAAQ